MVIDAGPRSHVRISPNTCHVNTARRLLQVTTTTDRSYRYLNPQAVVHDDSWIGFFWSLPSYSAAWESSPPDRAQIVRTDSQRATLKLLCDQVNSRLEWRIHSRNQTRPDFAAAVSSCKTAQKTGVFYAWESSMPRAPFMHGKVGKKTV